MRLNVAYAFNEAYVKHTGISMLSLFENNKDFDEIYIYIIDKEITDRSKNLLIDIANKYSRNLLFVPFEKICARLEINAIGRHIETIYAKLFFSQLEISDKILYLDSDTIISNSFKELWQIDMKENLVAGVQTIASKELKKLVGMDDNDRFINDGIVLINLRKWREVNLEDRFVNFIKKFSGEPPVHSEGTINGVCKGEILVLHPRYNLMSGLFFFNSKQIKKMTGSGFYSQVELNEAKSNPVAIHYLSAFYNRPWNTNCYHPLKDKYLHYKSMSEWANDPLVYAKMSLKLKMIKTLYTVLPFSVFLGMRRLFNKLG